MELQEIKEFLHSRPGYLKEGGLRLRQIFLNRGMITTADLCREAIRQVTAEINEGKEKKKLQSEKVLIYDIETSYNIVKSWRVGYDIHINPGDIIHERKIICISYKWLNEDQVYSLTWDDDQDDKFLLEQFIEVLNEADLIVAHNGDNYDLKFIKTRALKHRLPMLVNYNQFDTLKLAKKKFLFNSNKLDYIAKFLGHEGKISTELALWDNIILRKDPKALAKMLEYCDQDVLQLEQIYLDLVYWDNPKNHVGVLNGEIKQTSPITGKTNIEHVKMLTTNKGTVKHIMKDLDTNRLFEMSDMNYKKFLLINNKG